MGLELATKMAKMTPPFQSLFRQTDRQTRSRNKCHETVWKKFTE